MQKTIHNQTKLGATNKKFLVFFLSLLFSIFYFLPPSAYAVTQNASSATLTNGSTLTTGLSGLWTFDGKDMISGVAKDRSGNGYDGNPINIATSTFYTLGKLGQAFRLDGTDDYTTLAGTSAWAFGTGDFSVSLWMNASTWSAYESPFSNGVYGAGWDGFHFERTDFGSGCTPDTANRIVFVPAGPSICSTTTILTNTWYHVVGLRQSGVAYIYINGVQESSGAATGNVTVARNAMVGRNPDNTYPRYFNGKVDDVRVYNRALSAAEVKQLYRLGGNAINASSGVLATGSTLSPGSNNGLVGHWSFDGKDVVSGKVKDRSGSGNDGSPSGIATSTFYTTGKLGQAFNFDGTDDYIETGNTSTLNFERTDRFSVGVWVKTATTQTGREILGNGAYSQNGWSVINIDTNQVRFALANSSSNRVVIDANPPASYYAGSWTYIVFTYDGTSLASGVISYMNGGLVTQDTVSDTLSASILTANSFRIGYGYHTSNIFNGLIDDVRIYNRVLSAAEIKQLYRLGGGVINASSGVLANGSTLGNGNGLVAHWTFDGKDVVSGKVKDRSGSGNDGSPVSIATSTFYTTGKLGQAFNFDGTDDYVDTGTKFPSITSAITVSLWVKPGSSQGTYADILGNHQGDHKGIVLQQQAGNQNLYYFAYGNGSSWVNNSTGNVQLTANGWQHIAVVKDATTCYFYLNGTDQVAARGTCSDAIVPATTINFRIAQGFSDGGRFWNGTADEVRVYNRALTAAEIKQLYNLGR